MFTLSQVLSASCICLKSNRSKPARELICKPVKCAGLLFPADPNTLHADEAKVMLSGHAHDQRS